MQTALFFALKNFYILPVRGSEAGLFLKSEYENTLKFLIVENFSYLDIFLI